MRINEGYFKTIVLKTILRGCFEFLNLIPLAFCFILSCFTLVVNIQMRIPSPAQTDPFLIQAQ